tara:strand:+ start:23 stop:442 length:420 start_codon:yes stop_codon:yes gene_type:complete
VPGQKKDASLNLKEARNKLFNNMKNLKPIFINNSKIPVWLSRLSPINIWAFSFFIFVWCRGEIAEKTKRHETIHFQQQIELLFIVQWILYGIFYLFGLAKFKSGEKAYRSNPFEVEAYNNDQDENYLQNRKRYSWIKHV